MFNLESETHLTSCRKNMFAFIAFFFIILSIYSNTFNASWHFDDDQNIIKNEALHLKTLDWQNIKKTFFADLDGIGKIYRPVACFSLAINYYLGQENVLGYHIANISIHFIASIFLFLFIIHTLNTPLLKSKYGQNSYLIALLASILWTINPLQTQAVTYIVQRMASMAGMFYIMSMYYYLKGRISEPQGKKIVCYFLCFITGILAIGSKENAAMLPISIFFFDIFIFQGGISKQNLKKYSFILFILILIPLGLALSIKGPSLFSFKHLVEAYSETRGFTPFERLLTEPRILLFYVSLLLYPMPDRLCITHDTVVSHSLFSPPATLIAILFILIILGLALFKSQKWPLISYCIIFFFLNHIVESTILNLELVFEHRNYIPSMLFFVPIAILCQKGIQLFTHKLGMLLILTSFIVLVLVGQGHSTYIRNFIWKTNESLWLDAVDKAPNNPRSHNNLGRYYLNSKQFDKALDEFNFSLNLQRSSNSIVHHLTHYNIALIYQKDDTKKALALQHFMKAIEIAPSFSNAYNNIAVLKIEEGDFEEAFDFLIKALSSNKNNTEAHHNLGFVLMKQGRYDEAYYELIEALKINPSYFAALINLGIVHKYKGDISEALKYFKKAIASNTTSIIPYLHLLETYTLNNDKKLIDQTANKIINKFPIKKIIALLTEFQNKTSHKKELPNMDLIEPILGEILLKRYEEYENIGKTKHLLNEENS